jgi:hypothetical protein
MEEMWMRSVPIFHDPQRHALDVSCTGETGRWSFEYYRDSDERCLLQTVNSRCTHHRQQTLHTGLQSLAIDPATIG